jgi:hypothetical protein
MTINVPIINSDLLDFDQILNRLLSDFLRNWYNYKVVLLHP